MSESHRMRPTASDVTPTAPPVATETAGVRAFTGACAAGHASARLCACALAGVLCALPSAGAEPVTASATSVPVQLRHLSLDLQLDWTRRQAYGHATLELWADRPVGQIPLQAQDLDIVSVQDADGRPLPHRAAADAPSLMLVDLPQALTAGSTTRLRIQYRTRHVQAADPQNLGGSTGAGLRWFEPTAVDPRRRRQVWASGDPGTQAWWTPLPAAQPGRRLPGGPADAADAAATVAPVPRFTSDITLTVPRPLVAVASGQPLAVESVGDGHRRYRFRSRVPHTAQRLGFVVGDFVEIPQRAEGVRLMNWSYPDEAAATAASVEALPQTLRFLNQLTGRPYAEPAYTQVFVQDHPWGHPAQGLAVQSENMVDDFGVHADFQYLWDLLQAENLAHQWFGGVLSACDARHAWLERGLARYAAALYTEHVHGPQEMHLWVLAADHAAALAETQALVPPTLDDERAFATGPTPASRGAAVLHLLRRELGDAVFQRALQHFVRASDGRAVCSAVLLEAAQQASGRELGWFFRQWVYGAGYPAFTVRSHWQAARQRWTLVLQQTPAGGASGYFQGAIELEVEGTIHRVELQPQAENRLEFERAEPPRWVQLDPRGTWLMSAQAAEPAETVSAALDGAIPQLHHGADAVSRQRALDRLAALWPTADAVGRRRIVAALRVAAEAETPGTQELARNDVQRPAPPALADGRGAPSAVTADPPRRWWRERFNVLNRLRTLLQPARAQDASALDDDTRHLLERLVREESGEGSAWLRSAALRILGDTRDAALADLYLTQLGDASDRVINAAAIALGRTRDARAWAALKALRDHPSWKNQSLISALAGLRELGDPRGGDLALEALLDVRRARWVLATPVWDYPLAAAQALSALGQGARGVPALLARLDTALAGRDTTDVFYTLMLLAALGDGSARSAFAQVRSHSAGDPSALAAVDAQEAVLEQAMAAIAATQAAALPP